MEKFELAEQKRLKKIVDVRSQGRNKAYKFLALERKQFITYFS
jgi:hypothetical protein